MLQCINPWGQCRKYDVLVGRNVDLCPRDGASTRARAAYTPELGLVAGTGRGVLKTSRLPWRGRQGHKGRGRRGHQGRGRRGEGSARRGEDTRGEDGGVRAVRGAVAALIGLAR